MYLNIKITKEPIKKCVRAPSKVQNPIANERDMGLISALGVFHMTKSN